MAIAVQLEPLSLYTVYPSAFVCAFHVSVSEVPFSERAVVFTPVTLVGFVEKLAVEDQFVE